MEPTNDDSMALNVEQWALRALHYAAPISVIIYLLVAKAVAACLLHRPDKDAGLRVRRHSIAALLAAITVAFVAQAATYLAQYALQDYFWAPQDCVFYVLVSAFVYGCISVGLLETKTPLWHPTLGACLLALTLEIPLATVQAIGTPDHEDFGFARTMLHALRCVLLAITCIVGFWFAVNCRPDPNGNADEDAPLLADRVETGINGTAPKPQYGTISESDDDDDKDSVDTYEEEPTSAKELKAQQKKRLEEAGSWLSYLAGFKVLIPILWPSRQRLVQVCLGIVAIVIVVERFLNVLVPRQLGRIVDELTKGDGKGVFPWKAVSIWMLLSWLHSGAGLSLCKEIAELPIQQFSYKQIGSTAFAHVMGLSMDFHNDKNSGELIRAIEQGQALQGLLEFVLFEVAPMIIDIIVAFVYVSTLFDMYMGFIVAVAGIAYTWIGARTNNWAMTRRRRYNTAFRNESRVQNEAINNWQTVSHFNRGQYECERYDKSIDEFNKAEMGYYYTWYVGGGMQTLVMLLGRLAATVLAIYRVSQGTAPIGSLVTLTFYWSSVEGPLARVSYSIRRITSMLTDSERLLQLLTTQPTVVDAPEAIGIHIDSGRIEFEHVDFSYDPRRPTLKDISFVAKPGQTIALVGETKGGKSTILKLLYRYFDVAGGVIRIDGQDIRAVTLDSLRNSFGMVPQDPALFNISIMENVRYARLEASDEEVVDACRAAAIHEKISTFPDQYKATVGERGVKLSGGELQRVSIARAILRQPKIVLLDEATSMIDAETEALIQEAFRRLTAGRTTFIIAHRLSTIQHADIICVVNDGEIIEQGTHDELIKKQGKYLALCAKQLTGNSRKAAPKPDGGTEGKGQH